MLLRDYPESRIVGHRDLSPDLNHNGEIEPEEWIKECPCFDAATILQETPVNPGYFI
jgi:N-acetylmuramoyl-L-alanine amidase